MAPRHFLDLDQIDAATLRGIVDAGHSFKRHRRDGAKPLAGRTLAMIFEKPSTRTRVSFEVGIRELGGDALLLTPGNTQVGRGETIADTARVLSRYVDAIMMRTDSAERLNEMARHATIPVINGLTDRSHPCQALADVMTVEERRGGIAGATVAWSGDGNNVASSWIHAAARFRFRMRLACPETMRPAQSLIDWARAEGADVSVTADPEAAVRDADVVVTDTWVSMHAESAAGGAAAREKLHNQLVPYRVDDRLMSYAKKDAIFMHCLPAHRGEEVTDSVIDGPQSVVWDEAENRLHVQKGILAWCMA
ncbi:MAG: ornithine carbamoyltransferase [Alphaproteobacteria bacterium]|nr:ornithine carbamoyltransferase [Alphaproteobacteria bacterium]